MQPTISVFNWSAKITSPIYKRTYTVYLAFNPLHATFSPKHKRILKIYSFASKIQSGGEIELKVANLEVDINRDVSRKKEDIDNDLADMSFDAFQI